MQQAARRPITDNERRELALHLPPARPRWYLLLLPLATLGGLWFLLEAARSSLLLRSLYLLIPAFGFLVFAWGLIPHLAPERVRRFREVVRRDLAGGEVEEVELEAWAVAFVDDEEREAYYLGLPGNRTLFLGDPPVEGAPFPSTRFSVARAPASRLVLRVVPAGEYLEPRLQLPAFSRPHAEAGVVPHDGEVIGLGFEAVVERHAVLAAS